MTLKSSKLLGAATAACILAMLPAVAALTSCSRSDQPDNVAARVGSAQLTDAEIARAIPSGLSPADSLQRVEIFIDTWISNRLISDIAAKNIRNIDEIDRMTEEYRRNLIMMEYRRLKVDQDTALAITDARIEEFYAGHGGELRLEEPLVRGIFIAMSADSPQLSSVRRWYNSTKSADIERLEKVGLTEAITYEYFRDRWIPWSRISEKIPVEVAMPQKGKTLEVDGRNSMVYLLSVSDMLPAGASMPLDAAAEGIRLRLEALRKVELDNRLRTELYRKAIADGSAWRRPAK